MPGLATARILDSPIHLTFEFKVKTQSRFTGLFGTHFLHSKFTWVNLNSLAD